MSNDVPDAYWKQLLAVTTKVSDQSADSEPSAMTAENREWLESVMVDLVKETDPSKQLDHVMDSLQKYVSHSLDLSSEDIDKIEDLADRLSELLLYADLSPKFEQKGGLQLIDSFMNTNFPLNIRILFADAILTMTDNNIPAQESVIRSGLLKKILNLIKDETVALNLKLKLLGAVSTTVRSHEPALRAFMALEGHTVLVSLFSAPEVKLAAKAARVLTSIAYTYLDSPSFSKVFHNEVCRGYSAIAIRRADEIVGEIEFIREFINQSIATEDIEESTRQQLLEVLNSESNMALDQANQEAVKTLYKKINAPRAA